MALQAEERKNGLGSLGPVAARRIYRGWRSGRTKIAPMVPRMPTSVPAGAFGGLGAMLTYMNGGR